MWDEHGVCEFPFAPPGFPARLEGRLAIQEFLKGIVENVEFYRWLDIQFHLTSDPNTLIVEFRSEGRAFNTKRRYNQAYIGIVRVCEGKISLLKEYLNPSLVVEAFNTDSKGKPTA